MIKGNESGTPHSEIVQLPIDQECQLPSKCLHGILDSENLTLNTKKLD